MADYWKVSLHKEAAHRFDDWIAKQFSKLSKSEALNALLDITERAGASADAGYTILFDAAQHRKVLSIDPPILVNKGSRGMTPPRLDPSNGQR